MTPAMRWTLTLLITLSACDRSGAFPCVESESSAITLSDGGSPLEPGGWWTVPIRLDIKGTSAGEHLRRMCTGTRISSTGILVARHCFRSLDTVDGRIVGQSLEGSVAMCEAKGRFALENVSLHPSRDAALVRVTDPASGPLTNLSSTLPQPGPGFVMAGYGLDERLVSGELRGIQATVVSADEDYIVAKGMNGGACVGDSGAPLFLPERRLSVGLLSQGSASCVGQDEFVPTASIKDWLSSIDSAATWQ